MRDPTLVLRDIHQGIAPPWWPPAPGWWIAAALVLALGAAYAAWRNHERRKQRRLANLFDSAMEATNDLPAQVAAMSELLRRAGRRGNPLADKLHGEAWLAWLDTGDARQSFSRGAGRLLLDGGFRRDVDAEDVAALRALARARFIAWMVK